MRAVDPKILQKGQIFVSRRSNTARHLSFSLALYSVAKSKEVRAQKGTWILLQWSLIQRYHKIDLVFKRQELVTVGRPYKSTAVKVTDGNSSSFHLITTGLV